MSEKTKQFRSLLLEPLECRAVFSIDGLEVWQFSKLSLNFEFDRFQPAQYPQNQYLQDQHLQDQYGDGDFSTSNIDLYDTLLLNSYPGHSNDFPNHDVGEKRPAHNLSMHRGRFDNWDAPLPSAESEGPAPDSAPPKLDVKPSSVPNQPKSTQFFIVIDSSPTLSQSHDIAPASAPRTSADSSGPNRNIPTNFDGGNISTERSPISTSPNSSTKTSSLGKNSSDSTNAAATQPSLSSSPLSAQSFGTPSASATTTFDFSTRLGSIGERPSSTSLANQRVDDFRFTKPQTIPSPSNNIFDQALSERAANVESLESLLSSLAENHRRNRVQNGLDANAHSRNENVWRPDATSAAVAFAEGGMIALALNRDAALSELEDISEDAKSENIAWLANVGVYRAFENTAVAATEYAATEYASTTNRIGRNKESSPTAAELTEVESEVTESRLHPLLASTSAALGALMFGLRRIRKSAPLMFTSRKR